MTAEAKRLQLPADAAAVMTLHVGDAVLLSGNIVTARDKAHKWLTDTFIHPEGAPSAADADTYQSLRGHLLGGCIYHCGPIVGQDAQGGYHFLAAGPTTSIREEPYQAGVIGHFGLRAVIGKGGMGARTLEACRQYQAVYLHAVGGAAASLASHVEAVKAVYKLEFGMPEALWLIGVRDFPAVVTMDAHGNSLHQRVADASAAAFADLLARTG